MLHKQLKALNITGMGIVRQHSYTAFSVLLPPNKLYEAIDKKDEEIESLKEEINKLKKNQLVDVLSGVNNNDDTNWMNVDLKAQGMF